MFAKKKRRAVRGVDDAWTIHRSLSSMYGCISVPSMPMHGSIVLCKYHHAHRHYNMTSRSVYVGARYDDKFLYITWIQNHPRPVWVQIVEASYTLYWR